LYFELNDGKPDVGITNAQQSRGEGKRRCRGEKNNLVFPIKALSTLNQISVLSTAPSKQHHNNHEGKRVCLISVPKCELNKLTKHSKNE